VNILYPTPFVNASPDRIRENSQVVICGEVYSANLGDEILAHSFAYLLQQQISVPVNLLDLSSRRPDRQKQVQERPLHTAGQVGNPVERRFWAWVLKLPQPVALLSWWWWHWRTRRNDFYTQALQDATALVIGGGNLLIDNQLDFPLKVYGIAQCARRMGIPVFYYGCGVGQRWSGWATLLLRWSLMQAEAIAVRDQTSWDRLSQRLPEIAPKLSVVWDIAVCCAEAYDSPQPQSSSVIGLGICAPQVLARHVGTEAASYFQPETLMQFWLEIARSLVEQQHPIQLFTNGAQVDRGFAQKLQERLIAAHIPVHLTVALPRSGTELVQTIGSFHGVIAFRLHACIVAYSLGVPAVGLKWDTKVESFFEKCGRSHDCLDPQTATVNQITETLMRAIAQPQGAATPKAQSILEVAQLAKAISACGASTTS
jgi:polysaccharide pyruvyl transferase WcaK-like protein